MTTKSITSAPTRSTSTISESIRAIAAETLATTGGQRSYDYTPSDEKSASGTGIIMVSVSQLKAAGLLDPSSPKYSPVAAAKVKILWMLLDPQLDLVSQVSRSNPTVSDYMQEIVRQRLEEILEQKVLQNPNDHNHETTENGLDLLRLVAETPVLLANGKPKEKYNATTKVSEPMFYKVADAVGWARQILFASLAATTKRVFNNERANLETFNTEATDDTPTPVEYGLFRDIVNFSLPSSAEEQYLIEQDENELLGRGVGEDASESIFAEWEQESYNKRGMDKLTVNARALHKQFQLPELTVPTTASGLRRLNDLIESDEALVRRSLNAFYDLIAGEPSDEQLSIDDELISLWEEFDHHAAEQLLDMSAAVPELLAKAALALPVKPGRTALRAPRAFIRAASEDEAWPTLATRAFDSYMSEHFAWFNDHDNRGRTPENIKLNTELAADWPAAAKAVLAWPGQPAGEAATSVSDVAAWIREALAAGN